MERVTDLMDYNYQNQVSNKNAQSNLVQIILVIAKASIIDGLFSRMAPIIERELPVDTERYPGLSNLKAFLNVMSKEVAGMQVEPTMTEPSEFNPIGDYIDQENIHKTM